MVIFKYILYNLGRKKKQTLSTFLCITISSLIVLADFAMINSIESQLKQGINEVMSGQLTAYSTTNEQLNILESQLKDQSSFIWEEENKNDLIKSIPNLSIMKRLRIGSLISYGDETSYVHFHALENEHLEKIDRMLTFSQGRISKHENEIVISESMAKELKCTVGDSLLLVANNIHDYMSDAIGIVSGIFKEQGLAIFLNHNGFMVYDSGMELAGVEKENVLELVMNPLDKDDFTQSEIDDICTWFKHYYPDLKIAYWEQTVPLLYSITKIWRGGGLITQIVFIAFSLIILITLTSLVIHSRRKELGTLLAIGFSWKKIKLMVCIEYVFLACLSVLFAFGILEVLFHTSLANGIYIASEEMQSALMSEKIFLFLNLQDLLYVTSLFGITTIISALISIRRLQKTNIQLLIKE